MKGTGSTQKLSGDDSSVITLGQSPYLRISIRAPLFQPSRSSYSAQRPGMENIEQAAGAPKRLVLSLQDQQYPMHFSRVLFSYT